MDKKDIEKLAKNFVSALNKNTEYSDFNGAKYNDCQEPHYSEVLNAMDDSDPRPEKTDLEIAIENVLFGLKGTGNFTENKQDADRLFYNFVQAFKTDYVIDDSDLPEGITSETRIIFVVRLIEALIELLKFDLADEQNNLILEIMQFALKVLVDIAGNL